MNTYRHIFFTLLLALFFLPALLLAQSPRGFSYQAVARDAAGNIRPNTNINLEFSILDQGQTLVYEEDHLGVLTNDFGLFSLTIGKGLSNQSFSNVDWGSGSHFLVVTLDGLPLDTTELAAVPYAKVATAMKVSDLTDVSISTLGGGDVLKWNGTAWEAAVDEVEDEDADSTNEIQSLSLNADTLVLSMSADRILLPDADSSNELQSLSLSGNTLEISKGNSVQLPIYTAGFGIDISGQVITNTGDPDPTDDLTLTSSALGDVNGTFSNLTVNGIQGRPVSTNPPFNNYVLKWNGSQWTPGPDEEGTPIWSTIGNHIYYPNGRVGIQTTNPSSPLTVIHPSGTETTAKIEHTGSMVGNQNILELKVPATTPSSSQFLEMIRGSQVNASVDVDGDANFKAVTVREELSSSVNPEKGKVYANALPIAYGYISSTPNVIKGFGIASVSRPSTGTYEIQLRQTPSGFPVVIATSFGTSPDNEIITASSTNNSNIIRINIEEGGSPSNSNFYFVVYGDVQ